jgi:hypothetical protein
MGKCLTVKIRWKDKHWSNQTFTQLKNQWLRQPRRFACSHNKCSFVCTTHYICDRELVESTRYCFEPELCSHYSDCLRIEWPKDLSSSPGRVMNILFSTSSRPGLGPTQPPIQWIPVAFSPGVRPLGPGADHSPPTSSEVKKIWISSPTPPYPFMA